MWDYSSDEAENRYLNIWRDICYYNAFKTDLNAYEYFMALRVKYNTEIPELLNEIKAVGKRAKKECKKFQKRFHEYVTVENKENLTIFSLKCPTEQQIADDIWWMQSKVEFESSLKVQKPYYTYIKRNLKDIL